MSMNQIRKNKTEKHRPLTGFTIVEVLVSLSVFFIILLAISSLLFLMTNANVKTKANREVLDNARRTMEIITYEIKGARSIYTPTTTVNQLSLETLKYLPVGENDTFIDFFLCDSAICFKKESQSLVSLTSDSVQVTNLQFLQVLNGTMPSVKINLTVSYVNPNNNPNSSFSATLTSTVSLRNY